jgi:DNA polymerase-1
VPVRDRLGLLTDPLYLMDGSAFIFRGFYAFRTMCRRDGFPTNIIYIVTRLLLKLLREEKPSRFVFVIDGKGPNFRRELLPTYKANRSAPPEGLLLQIEPLRELLALLGLPVLMTSDCEADDFIASLALRFRAAHPVVILSADKDLKQCLHDTVSLWDPGAKEDRLTTLADFRAEYGIEPSSWPDFQALTGDAGDNIPGLPRIGPKTALALIRQFTTLEALFAGLAGVPEKVRPLLEGRRDEAMLYRELTRLRTDRCAELREEDLVPSSPDAGRLAEFAARYEMRALAREMAALFNDGKAAGALAAQSAPAPGRDAPADVPARPAVPQPTEVLSLFSARPAVPPPGEERLLFSAPPRDESAESLPLPRTSVAPGPQPAGQDRSFTGPGGQESQGSAVAGPDAQGRFFAGPDGQASSRQGGLFDAVPGEPAFPEIAAPETLPLPEQGADALSLTLRKSGGIVLCAGAGEYLYTGPDHALARFLVAHSRPRLVCPDYKALLKAAPALDKLPPERFFDLSLAAYLLNPEDRTYSFAHLAERFNEAAGGPGNPEAMPGRCALALYRFLDEHSPDDLRDVLRSVELPLVPVLARMEQRGIAVDLAALASFLDEVRGELDRRTAVVHQLAGRIFNIRSPQQLSDLLFSVLKLPGGGKTRGGAASTSQDVLEKLAGKHPVVQAVLDWRKLEKLRSTYLETLPGLADAEGRIHTTFNQTATATGRLSSSNPNLQNIPVRGAFGRRMRACFTAAPGKRLVCADYSQIELRVLACLSGEKALLDAFRNGQDIHARTAALLFDLPQEQISPDMRRKAKTVNFGLIYGMGAQKLARELGESVKDAAAFITRYFARLPGLKRFYDAVKEEAAEKGYVGTIAGRRRLTPDIASQNTQLRAQAGRQAVNARIQGSAADIIKPAMINAGNDPELNALEARLILQIHDELLLEVPAENAEAARVRLAAIMAGVKPGGTTLNVELRVDSGCGQNWAEAH